MSEFWRGAVTVLGILGGLLCIGLVVGSWLALTMDVGPWFWLENFKKDYRRHKRIMKGRQ